MQATKLSRWFLIFMLFFPARKLVGQATAHSVPFWRETGDFYGMISASGGNWGLIDVSLGYAFSDSWGILGHGFGTRFRNHQPGGIYDRPLRFRPGMYARYGELAIGRYLEDGPLHLEGFMGLGFGEFREEDEYGGNGTGHIRTPPTGWGDGMYVQGVAQVNMGVRKNRYDCGIIAKHGLLLSPKKNGPQPNWMSLISLRNAHTLELAGFLSLGWKHVKFSLQQGLAMPVWVRSEEIKPYIRFYTSIGIKFNFSSNLQKKKEFIVKPTKR